MNFPPIKCNDLSINYGVVESVIPEYLRDIINESIDQSRKTKVPRNQDLAGFIKKEYALTGLDKNTDFKDFIHYLCKSHVQNYPKYFEMISSVRASNGGPLEFGEPWVNFMRKGEYNPIHNHGGLFSYVIWVHIPFSIEDELNCFPYTTADAQVASFSFLFADLNGGVSTLSVPLDKGDPWRIMLFPSRLDHVVSPFYTSDGERISISGNIF